MVAELRCAIGIGRRLGICACSLDDSNCRRLPDDIGALRALILAERAEREQFAERIAILERLNTKLE